jgi:hypothetical protein
MPGVIIFNPSQQDVGFSIGDEQAAGVYLDIEADALYFTDTTNIYKWEGNAGTNQTYTWRSGKIRLPKKVNVGAALVEADSYDLLTFKLYADGTLITSIGVTDGEPFRLPGGYLSNIYEVEVIGTDVVTGISVAENIFELAKG